MWNFKLILLELLLITCCFKYLSNAHIWLSLPSCFNFHILTWTKSLGSSATNRVVVLQGALYMHLVLLYTALCYLKQIDLMWSQTQVKGICTEVFWKKMTDACCVGRSFVLWSNKTVPGPLSLILLSHLGEARCASLCSNSLSHFMWMIVTWTVLKMKYFTTLFPKYLGFLLSWEHVISKDLISCFSVDRGSYW